MDKVQRQWSRHYRQSHRSRPDCPDSRLVAALAARSVWPWQRRGLVEHLGRCSACADDFRGLLAAREGLRRALELAPVVPRSSLSVPRLGLIAAGTAAAGLCLALVLAVWLQAPKPVSSAGADRDTIFVSNFDPGAGARQAPVSNLDEVLFRSDFNTG